MEDLFTLCIIAGASAFGILIGLTALEEKFSSLKSKTIFRRMEITFQFTFLICALILFIAFLFTYENQPSAFEQCMEGAGNMIDPQAIAWMEDYCASQSYR